MKNTVKVWEGDCEDFSLPIDDMITLLNQIKAEHSKDGELTFRVEVDHGYYDDPVTADMRVERLETDKEFQARKDAERASHEKYNADAAAREKRQYEYLRQKFEGQK